MSNMARLSRARTAYTTRATWLGGGYGCRIYRAGRLIVEARCESKDLIGATFRDLFRTLDKCGGDEVTAAARRRKYKPGNAAVSAKHVWPGDGGMGRADDNKGAEG